jgi:hypothetical protein
MLRHLGNSAVEKLIRAGDRLMPAFPGSRLNGSTNF